MNWRLGYTILLWAMLPLVLARLFWRGLREHGYWVAWRERFGYYRVIESPAPAPAQGTIWVHAVSLGEVHAAKPLIEKLLGLCPQYRIVFSQMTATGRDAAQGIFGDRVRITWLPYDYPFAVRRFIANFNPSLGIFIETEIWFNLIRECKCAGIPLFLANARLSEKSAAGYLKIAPLSRRAFGSFDAVAAQTEADASRFLRLGAHSPDVVGNLKFDAAALPRSYDLVQTFRKRYGQRAVLLAASTRDGEEAMLLDALVRVPIGDILVVIVPRHPQRFAVVAELMKKRGIQFARRSDNADVPIKCNFVLGDSMGEMDAYYRSSDIAFVGGSLLDYGGQNLIEACAAGVPVLIGPFTRNFQEVADLAVEAGAAKRTMNARETVDLAFELLAEPRTRVEMGHAGQIFSAQHQGATDKTVSIVLRLLNADSPLRQN